VSATVAALYIDPRGPYPRMDGVECWDEQRDARAYDGPHPVVAHPPCGPWGNLRHLSFGAGRECGPLAVRQVRDFGGVLEHPAGSPPRLPSSAGAPDGVSGGRTRKDKGGGTIPAGIKACSAQQRRRTPPAFAEWLVSLARRARV